MSPCELQVTTHILAELIGAAEVSYADGLLSDRAAIDRARTLLSYLQSKETCFPLEAVTHE